MTEKPSLFSISDSKDYNYALNETLRYSHMIELEGYTKQDMAQVLLISSIAAMDYEDPWDVRYLGEDKERPRKIRISNFWDYAEEQAKKRYALKDEQDRYLEGIIKKYNSTKSTVRMFDNMVQNAGRPNNDIQKAFKFLSETKEELVIQGVSRRTSARAMLDVAFVFAYQAGKDVYECFCQSIGSVFENEKGNVYIPDDVFGEAANSNDEQISEVAMQEFLDMEPASTLIH